MLCFIHFHSSALSVRSVIVNLCFLRWFLLWENCQNTCTYATHTHTHTHTPYPQLSWCYSFRLNSETPFSIPALGPFSSSSPLPASCPPRARHVAGSWHYADLFCTMQLSQSESDPSVYHEPPRATVLRGSLGARHYTLKKWSPAWHQKAALDVIYHWHQGKSFWFNVMVPFIHQHIQQALSLLIKRFSVSWCTKVMFQSLNETIPTPARLIYRNIQEQCSTKLY